MSSNSQVSVKFDIESIRKKILSNILAMLFERKHISSNKLIELNKFFEKQDDNGLYIVDLDLNNIKPELNNDNYLKNFKDNKIYIKLFSQKIYGLNKSPMIKEFIDENKYIHKIIVFTSIIEKARQTLIRNPNTEVFNEPFFMLNLVEHIDSPIYEILNDEEIAELLTCNLTKNQLMKILISDPGAMYMNLKRGQIVRIIRCSEQTGISHVYRICAKA